jgi:hypothetical protein
VADGADDQRRRRKAAALLWKMAIMVRLLVEEIVVPLILARSRSVLTSNNILQLL